MSSGLNRRAARLEQVFRQDPFDSLREFWFVYRPDSSPLIAPEGARVVADLYEDASYENWDGRPGVTFRSGLYRERITIDPADNGKILPAPEELGEQMYDWDGRDLPADARSDIRK